MSLPLKIALKRAKNEAFYSLNFSSNAETGFWIGLQDDDDKDGVFEWTTGEDMSYSNFGQDTNFAVGTSSNIQGNRSL